jgi:hypothetical protein
MPVRIAVTRRSTTDERELIPTGPEQLHHKGPRTLVVIIQPLAKFFVNGFADLAQSELDSI